MTGQGAGAHIVLCGEFFPSLATNRPRHSERSKRSYLTVSDIVVLLVMEPDVPVTTTGEVPNGVVCKFPVEGNDEPQLISVPRGKTMIPHRTNMRNALLNARERLR